MPALASLAKQETEPSLDKCTYGYVQLFLTSVHVCCVWHS